MAEQDKHFGTDLGLDAATTEAVLKFVTDNSADQYLTEAGFKIEPSLPKGATPLRIIETSYWVRKHREITAVDWAYPLVESKNNCAACHSDADADAGSFEDGAMQIPDAPAKVTSASASASAAASASAKPSAERAVSAQ